MKVKSFTPFYKFILTEFTGIIRKKKLSRQISVTAPPAR